MKVIQVGAGKVGLAITRQLSLEGHDITVIDPDENKLELVSNMYDVITLAGSGASFDVLREADVGEADLLIAATGSDEINIVCSAAAKHFGVRHIAARLREPEYCFERKLMSDAFGMSAVFNPDMEAASEIARILQFPTAARVESFARGRGELVEYRIPAESGLEGVALRELTKRFRQRVLVCAVERNGEVSIPNGDFVLREGDRVSIGGSRSDIRAFFMAAGVHKKPVRSAILLGGSRISLYLAHQLLEAGIRVTIIEKTRERCDRLCDRLPDANVILGDGCDQNVLLEEGIRNTDAFVAATGFDEDNIIVSMYARECGVGKVICKLSDDHFVPMLERSGLDSFICPKNLAALEITRYARAMSNAEGESSMETLYRLFDDRVEAIEFVVGEQSALLAKPLRELRFRRNVLLAAVIRGSEYIVPNGETALAAGDRAVVVTTNSGFAKLDAIVE